MPPIRLFTKYMNNKLYDVDGARYIAVKELAAIVADGKDVKVLCDRTGHDITIETLVRALGERVKGYYHSKNGDRPLAEPISRTTLVRLIRQIPLRSWVTGKVG